jgi:hypothetical protein
MEEREGNFGNRKNFGRIVYSKSCHKNKRPYNLNQNTYQCNYLNNNIYEEATQRYDKIIEKAKKTIEDYKKQLNDEDYFNNKLFYDTHIKNQMNKFNTGQTDYRYYSPFVSHEGSQIQNKYGGSNDLSSNISNNNNGRCFSAQKPEQNNKYDYMQNNVTEAKKNYKRLFDDLYSGNNNKGQNNNNSNINQNNIDEKEINILRKKNIENERIIMENAKEKMELVEKIINLEKALNNMNNNINENRNELFRQNAKKIQIVIIF